MQADTARNGKCGRSTRSGRTRRGDADTAGRPFRRTDPPPRLGRPITKFHIEAAAPALFNPPASQRQESSTPGDIDCLEIRTPKIRTPMSLPAADASSAARPA